MPIYEYRCNACEHQFDAIQKLSDAPLSDCPACGAAKLRKLLSAPSFQLKGTGWYETDFKSKKKEGGDAKDGDAKGDDAKAKPKVDAGSEGKSADSGTKSDSSKAATGSSKDAAKPKPSSAPASD